MPFRDEHLNEGRGLLRVWTGLVTVDEVIEATRDFYKDPERRTRLQYIIVDTTEATFQGTGVDVGRLSSADGALIGVAPPELTIAVVAPKALVFGIARMWEVKSEYAGWGTSVFRTRAEAEEWIAEELKKRGAPI